MSRYLGLARRLIDLRALRVSGQACSLCRFPLLVKFGNNEHAVRCPRCRANPAAMAMAEVIRHRVPDLGNCRVYELSSRGPLFGFLEKNAGELVFSEFLEGVVPGSSRDGILCQDVQHLTFPDHSFDLCTCTDVLEHVADDARAFSEVHRVLRPGGLTVFTVPLNMHETTVERAREVGGQVEHLLPPEYHDDHLRGPGQVLAYRNYGFDIVDRMLDQGFCDVEIMSPEDSPLWGHGRNVVVGCRR